MNEAYHRALVSGQLHGIQPALLRLGLSGLACAYGCGAQLRSLGYNWRLAKVNHIPVPVVSLGNITTGGTGKTPFAAFLAKWFRERNIRVAFLSRGYGADPGSVNDEALVLDRLCPDVPHLQNPDRTASARIAVEELESQLLILDDGFQHRQLARDLDIVLIDATNPWGYDALLPRGLLREPLSGLRRAGLIVITRVDDVTTAELQSIHDRLERIRGTREAVEISFPARRLVNAQGEGTDWQQIAGERVGAFCGIGNPLAFRRLLERHGLQIEDRHFRTFPDHHRYTREDVDQLRRWADETGLTVVLTTQKDQVKLELPSLNRAAVWAVEIETEIRSGQELLERRLQEIASRIDAGVEY